MFPQRSKSAKVKKDLQALQFLIGQDPDTTELFEMAMLVATKRVVVKRPRKSPTLTNLKPSHTIEGSTIRFDVYLIG
jgi:16S rRNA (guanine1516-N2)-methyltransferase